ncbi:hypothetical protein Moror_609 [Moniliophthora roreri MCA 2997]|uniref:Uncharacterized protein n=2 Tax=Moniliophthora roreri TaxID=221103 RepID=V2WW22_MONRO|nr:hypothetical protein Moror_609 [Moniliophthora roreri MCA 2997]
MSAEPTPSSLTRSDTDDGFQKVSSCHHHGSHNKSGQLAKALESEHTTKHNGDLKGMVHGPHAPRPLKPPAAVVSQNSFDALSSDDETDNEKFQDDSKDSNSDSDVQLISGDELAEILPSKTIPEKALNKNKSKKASKRKHDGNTTISATSTTLK